MIDLQLIATNLLDSNNKLQDVINNTDTSIIITAKKLTAKYPELESLDDLSLISYQKTDKGISTKIIAVLRDEDELIIVTPDKKQTRIDDQFKIKKYKFTEHLSCATISNDVIEIVVNCPISKTGFTHIAKNDGVLEGNGKPERLFVVEIVNFISLWELSPSKYVINQVTRKKTKKYNNLLVHVMDIETGEIFRNIACNDKLKQLIAKYGNNCKFESFPYENQSIDEKPIKYVPIKDLNFKDDLSNLEI